MTTKRSANDRARQVDKDEDEPPIIEDLPLDESLLEEEPGDERRRDPLRNRLE